MPAGSDIVAGIRNIYADEILFVARIHPARPASNLTREEWEHLTATISEQLSFFIEKNRMTPEKYLQTKRQDYRNTPFLQIYGRGGESCVVFWEMLCRTEIGGRGSIFCPNCQKETLC